MNEQDKVNLFSYRGLQIETPFEYELRWRALNRQFEAEWRERELEFKTKLAEIQLRQYLKPTSFQRLKRWINSLVNKRL